MKVNISLLQINVLSGDFYGNFKKVCHFLEELPEQGPPVHFVVLPELWISGYSYNNLKESASFIKKEINILKDIVNKKSVNLIGSVPWEEKGRVYNRSLVIASNGDIAGFYDKIHLFKPLKENEFFHKGSKIKVIQITDLNFGLMICYDLRFPELSRALMLKNAKIIFVSAQWPKERIEHWILLNRVRAMENQIFIASCNSCGQSGEIIFGGNSIIVSPSGNILAKFDDNEQVRTFAIDLKLIDEAKKLFDIKEDIQIIQFLT